jgi:hypothetical protein
MNHAEAKAKIVVETVIPRSQMIYRQNQSNGTYDFDLHYPNGATAAAEVTASFDKGISRDKCCHSK